jgi:DNA mismatch endonuclease (patch repair protein)
LPKVHTKFWREKFERNVKRDKAKVKQLRAAGWKILTVWECEIKKDISRPLKAIKKILIK